MRAIIARAMPVLPDDGSMIVRPVVRLPSASASWTIFQAMRSLIEPPGFWPSSLARMRTAGLGLSALTSTIGVLPMSSRTEEWAATLLSFYSRVIQSQFYCPSRPTSSSDIAPSTMR